MTQLLILLASLALLVILVRLKLELGLALLAATVLLGVLAGLAPLKLIASIWISWKSLSTIDLLASLLSILVIENILRKQGYLQRVLASLRVIFNDYRVAMALSPAFLGFLPSAGGAVLSCPMIEEVAKDRPITVEQKSVANYWYRHLWEYSLPLYAGLLLAAKTIGVPVGSLIIRLFPFTILAALVGIPLALRGLPRDRTAVKASPAERRQALRQLLLGATPVIVVIIAVVAIGISVWLAVLAVCAALFIIHRYKPREILRVFKEALAWRTILLVAGIMAFRGMLQAAGMVDSLPVLFHQFGLPPLAMVILLPLILGALTGLSPGFVGAGFPLLMGLISPSKDPGLGWACLAFTAGFAGVLLTPLHFCFILTVKYFKASFGKVWLRIAPAVLVILALAIPYSLYILR